MSNLFTANECVSMMHENEAKAFRALADHFEKFIEEYTVEEVIKYLREVADLHEAEKVVVDLRDQMNNTYKQSKDGTEK